MAVHRIDTPEGREPDQARLEVGDQNQTFYDQMEILAGKALETLPRMIITEGPDQGHFCDRLRLGSSGQLERIDVSQHYGVIAMLGVTEALGLGVARTGVWGEGLERLRVAAAERSDRIDLGLMLWLDAIAHLGLGRLLELQLRLAVESGANPGSMQSAWMLTGAAKANLDSALQRRLFEKLMLSYRPATRMFVLGGSTRRPQNRFQTVLGSFASQIYPLFALSVYGQASGDREALSAARAVADRVCDLQGPAGEWWWILDTRKGVAHLDYPVYSVHQDSMAPMGLLAAAEALDEPRYVEHAARGVSYLFDYREPRSREGFFDERSGLIRRAIVRDYGEDPAVLPFGVSPPEMSWMRRAPLPAWVRGSLEPAKGFRFVDEARPYCLGWILHAAAQARAWHGTVSKHRPARGSAYAAISAPRSAPRPAETPEAGLTTLNAVVLIGKWDMTALTFARSCRERGIDVYLVESVEGASGWEDYSSTLSGGIAIPPERLKTPQGMAEVAEYARRVGAAAIMPNFSSDTLYFFENRAAFGPGCKLLAPTAKSRAIENDKSIQIGIARDVGFTVLPTWSLACAEDGRMIPESAFPVCLRPSDAKVSPKFKALVMPDRAALRGYLKTTRFNGSAILAQHFMDVPNLKVHGVRSESGRMLAMQAFCVTRKFRTVTLSLTAAPLPPDLETSCRLFVERCGLVGCFQFDMLWTGRPDGVYFLEINPRQGGTTDKVKFLGFDEPSLTLAAYGFKGRKEPAAERVPPHRTVVNKRVVCRHIVAALRGELTELDHPGGSRFSRIVQSCQELLLARDTVFDIRDLRGTFWYYCRLWKD